MKTLLLALLVGACSAPLLPTDRAFSHEFQAHVILAPPGTNEVPSWWRTE